MTELSNVATVLIARMESHPDDFDHSATISPKFGFLADYLTKLAGGGDSLRHQHPNSFIEEPFWFLSDADKKALVEAWKKFHYTKFEKSTMERIFDDGHGERELAKVNQQLYEAQQRAMIKNQMMQSTGTFGPQPVTALNAAQNSAGNYGLLGSASQAFSGIFK